MKKPREKNHNDYLEDELNRISRLRGDRYPQRFSAARTYISLMDGMTLIIEKIDGIEGLQVADCEKYYDDHRDEFLLAIQKRNKSSKEFYKAPVSPVSSDRGDDGGWLRDHSGIHG
jgi:hypothetical protein